MANHFTLFRQELFLVAGVSRRVTVMQTNFRDGPPNTAIFNGIADLEITEDGNTLYATDIFNYRIRKIDILRNGTVSTVLGQNHNSDGWAYGPPDDWASIGVVTGIGLSAPPHQTDLYITTTSYSCQLGVLKDVGQPNALFKYVCAHAIKNNRLLRDAPPGVSKRSCNDDYSYSGLPCTLINALDVIAIDANTLYVVYQHGITQIDLRHDKWGFAQCLQIAGYPDDINHRGGNDGIIPLASYFEQSVTPSTPLIGLLQDGASTLNYPYRLSYAADKGSLYVSDQLTKAVRRIFVNTPCGCVGGMMLLSGSNTCYNPSPAWSSLPLPACPSGLHCLF